MVLFLSTLSLRRATNKDADWVRVYVFLSTLSLRRATVTSSIVIVILRISIHALLAESDVKKYSGLNFAHNFYPRSPCGERLPQNQYQRMQKGISIHALLAESDKMAELWGQGFTNFYPRSPCGERQYSNSSTIAVK